MKKLALYLLFLLPALTGCFNGPKQTNWNVTLDHEGKNPYGTWIAYQTIPQYFPQAKQELISRSFRYTSIDNRMMLPADDSVGLLVMTGLNYNISDKEWSRLRIFVRLGNEAFIISSNLDQKVAEALRCTQEGGREETALNQFYDGTSNQKALSVGADTTIHYGYKGRSLDGTITILPDAPPDTGVTTPAEVTTVNESVEPSTNTDVDEQTTIYGKPEVIGYAHGQPNFIRYRYGTGHFTLHAAPLAFSNYFLLQDGNRKYLDEVWHSFPANISHVYWNEYYKRSTEGSSMSVLWRYPATRWALIIAIATLIIYVLLGIKRRQSIIPIVRPLENASVSFVETIGRLYFNKGNHANLAEKMIQHFLEWVRTYYFLETAQLNDTFVQQLVAKSGQSHETTHKLVSMIHEIRTGNVQVSAEYLHAFYNILQTFYQHQRS